MAEESIPHTLVSEVLLTQNSVSPLFDRPHTVGVVLGTHTSTHMHTHITHTQFTYSHTHTLRMHK